MILTYSHRENSGTIPRVPLFSLWSSDCQISHFLFNDFCNWSSKVDGKTLKFFRSCFHRLQRANLVSRCFKKMLHPTHFRVTALILCIFMLCNMYIYIYMYILYFYTRTHSGTLTHHMLRSSCIHTYICIYYTCSHTHQARHRKTSHLPEEFVV